MQPRVNTGSERYIYGRANRVLFALKSVPVSIKSAYGRIGQGKGGSG